MKNAVQTPERVLFIDDDIDLFEPVKYILGDAIQLDMASNISAALNLIKRHNYSVIITGLEFAGEEKSGFEVLIETRNMYPLTRIIVFSAHSSSHMISESSKLGAFDYISKGSENVKERLRESVYNSIKQYYKLVEKYTYDLQTQLEVVKLQINNLVNKNSDLEEQLKNKKVLEERGIGAEIKDLIADNRPEMAIEELLKILDMGDMHKQAILIKSRIGRLKSDSIKGIITQEFIMIENNRINIAIMDLIDSYNIK